MANREETSKITLDNSLDDDDELTMNELAQFFEELQSRYEISLLQNKNLKKKNEVLKNKLDIILKRKMIYRFVLKRLKRISMIINLFVRAKGLALFLIKMNF